MSALIAIDIGGTFTDLAAFLPETAKVVFAKRPTTHDDLANGVLACIQHADLDLTETRFIKHGTTVVINTLLERTGSKVALVCTRGFRDTLEIARGNIAEPYTLGYRRDAPLCERTARHELSERTRGDGTTLTEVDIAEVQALAQMLEAAGYEAVAVSFLNSYANPSHEQTVRRELDARMPGVFVTAGTDICREWYEYERTSTAVANAYVGPRTKRYLRRLGANLAKNGFPGRLLLMASNGGVLSPSAAEEQPLQLVESGPVGGCVGVARLAATLGIDNAIAFDMGGTTAKCALIERGAFTVRNQYDIGGYQRGLPIKVPVVDIIEVGAGGGSIAWLDQAGALHVGPRSAGSQPGPACYGWGGAEPTVSDANVVLGRLNPRHGLAGGLHLDAQAAIRAIDSRVTEPLAYSGEDPTIQAALGIIAIASTIMAQAIQQVSVERGRDPRDYTLVAYGGAGPLHACELARELKIPHVVIPREAGNFSAAGMLTAEIRRDHTRTFVQPVSDESVAEMNQRLDNLAQDASDALQSELESDAVQGLRYAELRYLGQHHTVTVPVDACRTAPDVRRTFERTYLQHFGHVDHLSQVEIVAIRVTVTAAVPAPDATELWAAAAVSANQVEPEVRQVVCSRETGPAACKVYRREQLPPGFAADGPAIVEEPGATTLIGPEDAFEVGHLGELHISLGTRASETA